MTTTLGDGCRFRKNKLVRISFMTFAESIRRNSVYLIGVVLLLCALYWKVVPGMVQQWSQDENYSHGFIVPLISAYFVYIRWDELKNTRAVA